MGDLFIDRFNSNSLAVAYAAFNIFMALFTMGMGNFYAFKVAQAMILKPQSAYTDSDRQQLADYNEYQSLKSRLAAGESQIESTERFKYLDNRDRKSELHSFISYITPLPFYLVYSSIVGIYIILGGLRAAAITDAVQGLLILVMSVLLIPLGLNRIGGFSGLHAIVPTGKFTLTSSDLAWHTVIAMTFASLVQIIGLLHNMSTGGSAKNEAAARFGMISGGFTKRLVLIAWMLCGLIAIAVLRGNLAISDPDNTWGALSHALLGPGLFGLMLSGMLLGHMPSVGVYAVSVAGLMTRNMYEPLVKGKSEKHYLRFGQWSIALVLIVAITFALGMSNVISAYTDLVTFNTFFGAAIFLILFWRRLTAKSIILGLIAWIVVMGIIPRALPEISGFRQTPSLLIESGKNSVYFDSQARVDPSDPNSPIEGIGRFNVENYALHLLHIPVQNFSTAQMTTVRWGFDGLFPFLLLIAFSLVTKPDQLDRADRFHAKIRTPVAPTPEEDKQEVQRSFENPHRFDQEKILARSNWQFAKWTTQDFLGFFGCWAIVGAILLVLWSVLNLGS